MLNSGNNDRLLLSPRVKRAQSDWWATVTPGCQRCHSQDIKTMGHNRNIFQNKLEFLKDIYMYITYHSGTYLFSGIPGWRQISGD
jgi:hypothetical protein